MNTSHHPEMPDTRIPSDLRRAFEHAAEDAGLPLPILPQTDDLFRRFADHYLPLRALPRRARRALERRWARSVGTLALLLALGQAPAWAATIPVDGIGCTLVEAITAANSDSPVGGCTAGSGADTIVLPAGSTHTLISRLPDTTDGDDRYFRRLGYAGLPLVTSPITIEGNGSTVRRENGAPDDFRVFTVGRPPGQLTLRNTTVSGGRLQGISGFDPDVQGGGLLVYEGVAVLENSTVTGNTAGVGGGISSRGGALFLTDSTISSNTAYAVLFGGAGGLSSDASLDSYAYLRMHNSTISGNYTRDDGGGLTTRGSSTALITNSVIVENYARESCGGMATGSDVSFAASTVTVTNSTIAGNTAAGAGASFRSAGGGLCNYHSPLTIVNTTVSHNVVSGLSPSGGGINNRYGAPPDADQHDCFFQSLRR